MFEMFSACKNYIYRVGGWWLVLFSINFLNYLGPPRSPSEAIVKYELLNDLFPTLCVFKF